MKLKQIYLIICWLLAPTEQMWLNLRNAQSTFFCQWQELICSVTLNCDAAPLGIDFCRQRNVIAIDQYIASFGVMAPNPLKLPHSLKWHPTPLPEYHWLDRLFSLSIPCASTFPPIGFNLKNTLLKYIWGPVSIHLPLLASFYEISSVALFSFLRI